MVSGEVERMPVGRQESIIFWGLGVEMSKLSSPAFSSSGVFFRIGDKCSGMHLICAKMFLNFVYQKVMFNFDSS